MAMLDEKTTFESDWEMQGFQLLDLLRDHVPPNHRTRYEFEHTFDERSDDWRRRNPREVESVVRSFYDLPIDEQTSILNGWTPHRNQPSAGALEPRYAGNPVRVGVTIEQDSCRAVWVIEDSIHPSCLVVFGNTTKAEVMAELREKIDWVDKNWDKIRSATPAMPL